jgi:hypothetical protein
MGTTQWYELRIEGSAGTPTAPIEGATREGLAVSDQGRLCTLSSESAMRFESEQEAKNYLFQLPISQFYRFVVVLCSDD